MGTAGRKARKSKRIVRVGRRNMKVARRILSIAWRNMKVSRRNIKTREKYKVFERNGEGCEEKCGLRMKSSSSSFTSF